MLRENNRPTAQSNPMLEQHVFCGSISMGLSSICTSEDIGRNLRGPRKDFWPRDGGLKLAYVLEANPNLLPGPGIQEYPGIHLPMLWIPGYVLSVLALLMARTRVTACRAMQRIKSSGGGPVGSTPTLLSPTLSTPSCHPERVCQQHWLYLPPAGSVSDLPAVEVPYGTFTTPALVIRAYPQH